MLKYFLERTEAHEQGVPISIGDERIEDGGAYIKVKRVGTSQHEREMTELRATKYSAFNPATEQDQLDLATSWLAEYGVTGWHGIEDPRTGNPLEFDRKVCRQIIKNPQYLGLVTLLMTEANRFENFVEMNIKAIEDDLKKPLALM